MHGNGTRNGVLTDVNGETGNSRCRYAKLGGFPGKNPHNGTPVDGSDIPTASRGQLQVRKDSQSVN